MNNLITKSLIGVLIFLNLLFGGLLVYGLYLNYETYVSWGIVGVSIVDGVWLVAVGCYAFIKSDGWIF